jgi:hypothetical protein
MEHISVSFIWIEGIRFHSKLLSNLKLYAFEVARRYNWDVVGSDKEINLGMYFNCYNDTFEYNVSNASGKYYSFKMDIINNSESISDKQSYLKNIIKNYITIYDVIMALETESANPISRQILDLKKDKLKVDAIEEAAAAAAAARFAGRKTTNPGDGLKTPATSRPRPIGKFGSGSAAMTDTGSAGLRTPAASRPPYDSRPAGSGEAMSDALSAGRSGKRASFDLNPRVSVIDSNKGQEWVGRDTIERTRQDSIAEEINANREYRKNAQIILNILKHPETNSGLNQEETLRRNIAMLNRGISVNKSLGTITRTGVMLNFIPGISDTKSSLISVFNSILPEDMINVNQDV